MGVFLTVAADTCYTGGDEYGAMVEWIFMLNGVGAAAVGAWPHNPIHITNNPIRRKQKKESIGSIAAHVY